MIEQIEIQLPAYKRGFHMITAEIVRALPELPQIGIVHLFLQHTSAALSLNENADPGVSEDLNSILNHLIKEGETYYTHTYEGNDDMPAHAKSSLLGVSLTLPVTKGKINLGTWQGIYLCEFRDKASGRKIVATILGE